MESLDNIKPASWASSAKGRRPGPLANSAAMVLAVILISAPWLTGAAWLMVYFWNKLN